MYPINVNVLDCSTPFPGFLYLPGETVPGCSPRDTCDYCGWNMGEAGTADPLTGGVVSQDPATGQHDGVVSAIYSPSGDCRPMEASYSHLRCLLESATSLGAVEVGIGSFDPWQESGTDHTYEPRHAAA